MSGAPLITSAIPECRNLIDQFHNGVYYNPEKPGDFHLAIDKLFADYDAIRQNAETIAPQFKWSNEAAILKSVFEKVLRS
jgi:glycosyltransferase involved in cell wall biosynthesis